MTILNVTVIRMNGCSASWQTSGHDDDSAAQSAMDLIMEYIDRQDQLAHTVAPSDAHQFLPVLATIANASAARFTAYRVDDDLQLRKVLSY